MFAQVALKLTGPMDHLRLVWQTGETLLESVVFDDDPEGNRYNVLLALQEVVTNVLRHSYKLDQQKPIEVRFDLSDDRFVVELRDQGPPFDPLGHEVAGAVLAADMPTQCGGFGIHIVRIVMDEIEYRREGGWNVLRLAKDIRVIANT
jgi:anti-sigma regulatory factor (Ser/Thr protein kinase)